MLIRCLGCMQPFDSQYHTCPYCGYEHSMATYCPNCGGGYT